MAISKIDYFDETLIDLTSDTVTADALTKGVTAHDKSGVQIAGTLTFATVYTGSAVPDDNVGEDGDIFLVIGG